MGSRSIFSPIWDKILGPCGCVYFFCFSFHQLKNQTTLYQQRPPPTWPESQSHSTAAVRVLGIPTRLAQWRTPPTQTALAAVHPYPYIQQTLNLQTWVSFNLKNILNYSLKIVTHVFLRVFSSSHREYTWAKATKSFTKLSIYNKSYVKKKKRKKRLNIRSGPMCLIIRLEKKKKTVLLLFTIYHLFLFYYFFCHSLKI